MSIVFSIWKWSAGYWIKIRSRFVGRIMSFARPVGLSVCLSLCLSRMGSELEMMKVVQTPKLQWCEHITGPVAWKVCQLSVQRSKPQRWRTWRSQDVENFTKMTRIWRTSHGLFGDLIHCQHLRRLATYNLGTRCLHLFCNSYEYKEVLKFLRVSRQDQERDFLVLCLHMKFVLFCHLYNCLLYCLSKINIFFFFFFFWAPWETIFGTRKSLLADEFVIVGKFFVASEGLLASINCRLWQQAGLNAVRCVSRHSDIQSKNDDVTPM